MKLEIFCKSCKAKGISIIDVLLYAAAKSGRFKCRHCNETFAVDEDSRLIFSVAESAIWILFIGLAFYFLNYWIAFLLMPTIAFVRVIFVGKCAKPIFKESPKSSSGQVR